MGMKYIDGEMLKKAFLAGAKGLEAKKEWINELNVFPVPDGDTGTNMTMTIMSAAREVAAIEHPDMESLAKAISCVTTIIVKPVCDKLFNTFKTSVVISGSNALVGSSQSNTSGSMANARAIATRCFSPPDS